MRTKSFILSTYLLLCFGLSTQAQDKFPAKTTDSLPELELIKEIKLDSISIQAKDSIPTKEPLLLDLIRYTAQDSVKINQKTNKIRLYNKARIEYQDMELEAGLIVMDYSKNEVYAGRIADSTGVLSQKPVFVQGKIGSTPTPSGSILTANAL